MKILIIIPAYNESHCIIQTIAKLKMELQSKRSEFEILVVNDGSKDDTGICAQKAGVLVINLPYNMGIGNAVQTGYKYAKKKNFDVALQLDADGQHPIAYIPFMLEKLVKEKLSLCIGSRFLNKEGYQSTVLRKIGIVFFRYFIYFLTGLNIKDPTSGFRMIDRKGIELLSFYYPEDYAEPECIIYFWKNGLKISEISVIMSERKGGCSSITIWRSVYYMIKVPIAILVSYFRPKLKIKESMHV